VSGVSRNAAARRRSVPTNCGFVHIRVHLWQGVLRAAGFNDRDVAMDPRTEAVRPAVAPYRSARHRVNSVN